MQACGSKTEINQKTAKKHLAFGVRIGYNTIRSASAEFAGVAQLVERVIGNDEVHGSDSHHQLQTENHPKSVQPRDNLKKDIFD